MDLLGSFLYFLGGFALCIMLLNVYICVSYVICRRSGGRCGISKRVRRKSLLFTATPSNWPVLTIQPMLHGNVSDTHTPYSTVERIECE